MAINFPDSPSVNSTYTSGNTTWKWDGTSWVSNMTPSLLGVKDEGVSITTSTTSINFTGVPVAVTNSGTDVTVSLNNNTTKLDAWRLGGF